MHSKSIPPDDSPYKSEAPPADLYPLSGIAATRNGNVPFSRILRVLADVGGALSALHRCGRIHGNISIDSVGLDGVGRAYLMTAATDYPRSAGDSALRDGRASGYNAFEQYTDDPQWRVGPWTDVYALCAVAYRLTTGAAPPSAIDRCVRDTLETLSERALKGYPIAFLEAIDRGLALRPQDRFDDVHALLVALGLGEDAAQRACAPADVMAHAQVSDLDVAALGIAANAMDARIAVAPDRGHASKAAQPSVVHSQGAVSATPARRTAPASTRRARVWPWLGWPAGLISVAMVGYLWMGSETASPQISGLTPIGSGAPASGVQGRPAAAAGAVALPDSSPVPAAPPDIYSRNISQPAAPPAGRPVEQASLSAAVPPVIPPQTDATGNPVSGNVPAGQPAAEEPATIGAAPTPVKPASAVRVSIDIRPWGEVFVDGASRGVSPPLRQLSLPPGNYQITVRNPNAPSYSKRVTISPGQRAVAISHQFGAP